VREVLDAGAREIDAELAGEPEVRDRVLELVASVYLQLGEYDAALPLAERRLALRRERFGAGSLEAAEGELLAANILWDRGRLDESERRYRAAAAVFERRGDPESAAAREAAAGVAACLRARGDLAGAERLQRLQLEIARRVDGPASAAALGVENSLAMTLGTGERYAESAALLGEIVAADRRAGRAELPDGLTHRYNLAVDLVRGGDWPAARTEFATLVPATRRVLGERHPRLASVLRWQAWLLDDEGHVAAAAAVLAECERIQVAAFGDGDPQLAWTRALAARIAAHAGDATRAEASAEAALVGLERALGKEDAATGLAWEALAEARLAAGKPAAARTAARRAVELRERSAVRGRSLAAALDLAGRTALAAGDAADAVALGSRSLEIWAAAAPPGHPEAARARLHLAGAQLAAGGAAAARALLDPARPVLEASFAPGAPSAGRRPRSHAASPRATEPERGPCPLPPPSCA